MGAFPPEAANLDNGSYLGAGCKPMRQGPYIGYKEEYQQWFTLHDPLPFYAKYPIYSALLAFGMLLALISGLILVVRALQ